jgi:superfamily II DNA or RNA helicase
MSILLERQALSENYVQKIQKDLTLHPVDTSNRFRRGKRAFSAPSIPPIKMYVMETVRGKEYVGLPYFYAQNLLRTNPYYTKTYPSKAYRFTGTLRSYQKEAIPEVMEMLDTQCTTTLRLHPGYGKTIVSAYLACHYHLLTVVLLPNQTTLLSQWYKTFEKHTNANIHKVGEPKKKQGCPIEEADVLICMPQRISKIPQDLLFKIGMLIVDEAHMLCVPSGVKQLLAFHPKYIVAQSATLERDDGMHEMIYKMCGKHHLH